MCLVYIIYSNFLDKYYIGYTCDDLKKRLQKHNSNHKGFTGTVNDWVIKYQQAFSSKKGAMTREMEIKRKKSRKYIEFLISNISN